MGFLCCTLDAKVRETSLSVDLEAEALYLEIYAMKDNGSFESKTLNLKHRDEKTISLDQECSHLVRLVLHQSYYPYDRTHNCFGTILIPRLDSNQTVLSVRVDSPADETVVTIVRKLFFVDR